jgi:SH3-like domain-containing protein
VREIRARFVAVLLAAQICGAVGVFASAASAQKTLTPGSFKAYAAEGIEPRVSEFSGYPVPRYASLRYDQVNGRSGPSPDYPVRWIYERAGLPVVVVRESNEWRKIRDPQGDEVWVNKSQLAEQRTAITTDSGAIRRDPKRDAAIVVRFSAGAVLTLRDCGTQWCRVEAEGRTGWAARSQLWGADPLPGTPGKR